MMQSKLDWKDTENDDHNGSFRVFVLGEVTYSDDLDKRELKGSIFIYPVSEEADSRSERYKMPQFQIIHSAKDTWKKEKENIHTAQIKLANSYDQLNSTLCDLGYTHKIDYNIKPCGLIYLDYDKNKIKCSDDESYIITRQAYYYLKYSLHEHKHHDDQMDALMTIVKNTSEVNTVGLKLLGQLKRELTSIKRTFSRGERNDSSEPQGIVSYMSSLCKTLECQSLLNKETYERERVYIESVKSSFAVQATRNEKGRKEVKDVESEFRTYLAITISIFSILTLIFVKPFIEISKESIISIEYPLWKSIILVAYTSTLVFLIYQKLKYNRVKDTLSTEGFKKWVDKYYKADHDDIKELFIAWLVLVVSVLIITIFL